MTDRIKRLRVMTPQGDAGNLDKADRFVFNYNATDRACEVSLGMPIRSESYASSALPNMFAMNSPEGYLLDRIYDRFGKLFKLDDMRLLALTGANQIGRLRYAEPDAQRADLRAQVSLASLLKTEASEQLFSYLVDTYLQTGISGFQPKVMIPDADRAMLHGERATILVPNLIVKASGDDYPHLAQNEFLCMEAARIAGLRVPEFWLAESGQLFVMNRFDLQDGLQLGFEDMAVLMNQPTRNKYLGSYESIARTIHLYCGENAVESKRRLFQYVALSVMVRNSDAHLKNFGLLYASPASGAPSLSPLYDVVTTTVYKYQNRHGVELVDREMALKLNKDKRYPSRQDMIAFGKEVCGELHPEQVIERISDAMTQALEQHAPRIDPTLLADMRHEWDGGRMSLAAPGAGRAKRKAPTGNTTR